MIKNYFNKVEYGKNSKYVTIICDVCNKERSTRSRNLLDIDNKHWCSQYCMSILKGTRVYLNCTKCNKCISKRKSKVRKNNFCSRKCQYSYTKGNNHHNYLGDGISLNYRALALKNLDLKCNRCSYNIERALEVHHIDRNRNNNKLENLELLCANCHRLEHYN